MTTNIGESMNARLKDARYLPITVLADYFRSLLQQWFDERRLHHSQSDSHLTTWAEKIISERRKELDRMRVRGINFTMFEVYTGDNSYVVDLQGRTCTCRVFDLDQLPCAHVMAVCKYCNLRSCDEYCSPMYTVERLLHAYACPVIPVGNSVEWIVPDEVKNIVVLPPEMRRPAGRPKKLRIPSVGEEVHTRTCSRCGQHGHNRKTCKNPVPLNTVSSSRVRD